MNSMIEFMSRELIREKIDFIADKFFDFKITNDDLKQDLEDGVQKLIEAISQDIAASGTFEEQMPRVIAYLLDTVVAQQITIKLQEYYILSVEGDEDEE